MHLTQVEHMPDVGGDEPFHAYCFCGWESRWVSSYEVAQALAGEHRDYVKHGPQLVKD